MTYPYASGKWALGICDRCGRQYKLKTLKWQIINLMNTNLLHCDECLDPDQPQLQIGRFPIDDPQAIQNPRPDPDNDRGLFGYNPVLGCYANVVLATIYPTVT